jgi:hypothetical protein
MSSVYGESGGFSDFMNMRLKQLSNFGFFYLGLNSIVLILTLTLYLGFVHNQDAFACLNECAFPLTEFGAFVRLTKWTFENF